MTKEETFVSLDAMLANPKSKNFLNHLIRAYMPVTNVVKVFDRPKTDFKCVLTREALFSTQDIVEDIHTEEFKADFMNGLKTMFDEKADKTTAMAKLIGDKKLGLTGKDTTTFMSYTAYQDFMDWVITKALKGDKHINWLLASIKRSSFINRAENINDTDVQKKVAAFKKQESKGSATYKIGDSSDVLAKLKAALESQGN